jgi:polyketide synthase PksN
MVIESYDREAPAATALTVPYHLIVLSARNEAALHQSMEDLLNALQERSWDASALQSMSCTLLCRRHHFKHRCAVIARDALHAAELLRKLIAKDKLPNAFTGVVATDFAEQPMLVEYVETMLATLRSDTSRYSESLRVLADLYCQGYRLPWRKLFGDTQPRHVSLPGYPFSNRRYWIDARPALAAPAMNPLDKPRGIVLTSLDGSTAASHHVAPLRPAEGAASDVAVVPTGDIGRELTDSLAAALLIPVTEIDPTLSFVELGMDSVIGAQWSQAINRRFATRLTLAKLYQYPTIAELAACLTAEMRSVSWTP